MDQNLSDFEFKSLSKKEKHTYLYKLLDYKHKIMIPFNRPEKISQDLNFIHQMAHEFYDDGNPSHYANESEERELDIIEITRIPISEINFQSKTSDNFQYQAEITTHPPQLITPHHSYIPEYSENQAGTKTTSSQFVAPHQFQIIDGFQQLDGMITSPPDPGLLQFIQQEDPKTQDNSLKGINFSSDRSANQSQREPPALAQNEGFQDDRLSQPSQAKIVPMPSQTSDIDIIAQPQSAKLRLFNGFPTMQEALQSARERDNDNSEGESKDRDGHINPSEEFVVPRVDHNAYLEQEGRSDLNERNLEPSAEHFEGDNGIANDCDYEIPRHETMRFKERGELSEYFNIGLLESTLRAENSKGGNRTIENNDLEILGDKYLGTEEMNTVHLENSLLSLIMESLEEGGEKGSCTYNGIFNSCHIPAVEDTLAMMGTGPTAAGIPETFEKEAGPATRRGFHGGVYDYGDYPASKERKLMPRAEEVDASERHYNQLHPAGRYGLGASDNSPPNNRAEENCSVSQNKYSLPAGGYGILANENFPQNYGVEESVNGRPCKDYCLARRYRLAAASENSSQKNEARGAADTNHYSETPGQRDFSHEQYRVPRTMKSHPVSFNREPNNEAHPSSFEDAQFGRHVAPGVQPRIQMPRPGENPESDTILPSIEFDIIDENNTTEQPNNALDNRANLSPLDGNYSTKANPVDWGMSLSKEAPDSFFRCAGRLENQIEADFQTVWMNEQIQEDHNPPIPLIDPNYVAQDRLADQYAREFNARLESEGKAAMWGTVFGNATLQQMPPPATVNVRPFFFGALRRPRKPGQPRRMSLTSIRSPKVFSPPRETGPEIPTYDFSTGEIPISPPDFNTAQEIKRRLLAKNAISSEQYNKRCGACGYMGHVSKWPGCPALVCELCKQEGHGRGFCPQADVGDRWRDRHGKTALERSRMKKVERTENMAKRKLERMLCGQEVGQSSQVVEWRQKALEDQNTRGYSQEALSPRSLGRKRQRLADENQARINEEGPIAPMNQAQITDAEMRAYAASMIAGPEVSAFQNAQTIAPTNQLQINAEEMRAPIAQMATWPMANSFESTHNIASTTKDDWPYGKTNIPEWQPWVDMNTDMLMAPVAQMETGPMVNSFENQQNIAPTTNGDWPYAEWQPCDDPRISTQRQENTLVGKETTLDQQGYSNDLEVAQHRLKDFRAPSAESIQCSEYTDFTDFTETESQ